MTSLSDDERKERRRLKKREYNAAYRERNREEINAREVARRAADPFILDKRKKWRESNPEATRASKRKYYESNTDKWSGYRRSRRARIMGNECTPYTVQEVIDAYGTICHLCCEEIDLSSSRRIGHPGWERGLHVDHVITIVEGGPDTLENVRPSHGLCNLRKPKRSF